MVGSRANAKIIYAIALNIVDVEEYDDISDLFDEAIRIAKNKDYKDNVLSEDAIELKDIFFKARVISDKIAYSDSISLTKDELRDKVMDYIMSMFNN